MQPLHSGIISVPGSPKTRTWKLSPILVSKITENHKIMPKVGPRRLPKSIQKSIKIEIWASVRPVGVPLDPRITKMVSRAPKKEPQGLQNDSFWKKKWFISGVIQSSVACWQGAGGRGEALRYICMCTQPTWTTYPVPNVLIFRPSMPNYCLLYFVKNNRWCLEWSRNNLFFQANINHLTPNTESRSPRIRA